MAKERWEDLIGSPSVYNKPLPAAPKNSTPRTNYPKCPDHCSGRHQVDGFIQCPTHRVKAYKVLLHEYPWQDGHFWQTLEPMNGKGASMDKTPKCPDCGKGMVRVWSK